MTEEGYKYILICRDSLCKYLLAIPMITQTAGEVALTFLRYVILHYCIPNSIVTDQGSQFMCDIFKRLCRLLKIRKLNTTAYHPEINAALERTHKTMTEYSRCFCNSRNNDWDKWLPFACLHYTTHTMTKYTPYEIVFGRKVNLPGQLQQRTAPLYNYDDIVHDVKQKLQICHEIARANLMKSKQRRVAQQSSKVNMLIFNKGDKVLLRNEKAGKLYSLWAGPCTIYEVDPSGSTGII